MIICKDCGTEKEHKARGMCGSCYNHWYYRENHERELERARRYREENPEKVKASRLTQNRWRKQNPSWREKYRKKALVRGRQYYEEHREERAAYNHHYQRENPDKIAIKNARRRAHKLKVANTLTPEQTEFERKIGDATYPEEELHLHHLVPLSRGGGHTWGNVVFIPAFLNLRINDRLPEEVYEQLTLDLLLEN